jgi:hypothetical protein
MAGKLCAFVIDGRECRREMTEKPSDDPGALRIFICPLGHRLYGTVAPATDQSVTFRQIGFRQPLNGDTWHFSKDCSQWPTTNFSSVSYMSSEATICNECLAKSSVTP